MAKENIVKEEVLNSESGKGNVSIFPLKIGQVARSSQQMTLRVMEKDEILKLNDFVLISFKLVAH